MRMPTCGPGRPSPAPPTPTRAPPLLEARGLVVVRRDARVLDGIDITLAAGERIGVEGAVGAGKSTLLLALLGLLPCSAGVLCADGHPLVGEASFAALRRRAGLLFQSSDDQLFHASVAQDVAFGPRAAGLDAAAATRAAQAALAELGIAGLHDAPIGALSGGQKRLVALAGLIAMRPQALLLDEPTAGLDAVTRARVLQWLHAAPLGLLVASHDPGCLDALVQRRVVL